MNNERINYIIGRNWNGDCSNYRSDTSYTALLANNKANINNLMGRAT